eukprot:GDKJ01023631.1.p1 GENE.GDKJ01023631.1~~GDKJ01023631.1.p1  ORF type:complete len:331 (-),score=79.03 GDKJ01023631.1:241-1233(-)
MGHYQFIMEDNRPVKAYKNSDFLASRTARNIRILCEHEETEDRMHRMNVGANIMVFGSARSLSEGDWAIKKADLLAKIADVTDAKEKASLESQLERHEKLYKMTPYHEKTEEVGRLLTQWAMDPDNRDVIRAIVESVDSETAKYCNFDDLEKESPLVLCTGGGPGLMEAANKGAASIPNGRSMGMGVSLPFENKLNEYVSPGMGFEFHYFFTRKFWMVYYTSGIIATPGGVGTLDELFEVMTLKQTGKISRDIPIVLFGAEYWKNLINFDLMVEWGVIASKDRDQILYTESAQEAVDHIVSALKKEADLHWSKKAAESGAEKKTCFKSCV